jgi:hypothetical protein
MNPFNSHTAAIFILLLSLAASCEMQEDKPPQEMLQGKWIITHTEWLTQTIPGNGSYLIFEGCSSVCTGTDYEANEGTSGSFIYYMDEQATYIEIEDENSDGGNYNTTWDILDLTDKKLRIVGDFGIFGSMNIELSKSE